MNKETKTSRILGIAFLIQFVTSFSSAVFLNPVWTASGNISETMLKIANNPGLVRANILEGSLLAASRTVSLFLLRISQEYAAAGYPDSLQQLGSMAYDSMNFTGSTLHMLAFCFGGILFYYLLYKSGMVPRALSLWGLITVFPMLAGTVAQVPETASLRHVSSISPATLCLYLAHGR